MHIYIYLYIYIIFNGRICQRINIFQSILKKYVNFLYYKLHIKHYNIGKFWLSQNPCVKALNTRVGVISKTIE